MVIFVEEFDIVQEPLGKSHEFAYEQDKLVGNAGKAAQKSNNIMARRNLVGGDLGVSVFLLGFSLGHGALA